MIQNMQQMSSKNLLLACPQLGTPTISITSDVLGFDDNVK